MVLLIKRSCYLCKQKVLFEINLIHIDIFRYLCFALYMCLIKFFFFLFDRFKISVIFSHSDSDRARFLLCDWLTQLSDRRIGCE